MSIVEARGYCGSWEVGRTLLCGMRLLDLVVGAVVSDMYRLGTLNIRFKNFDLSECSVMCASVFVARYAESIADFTRIRRCLTNQHAQRPRIPVQPGSRHGNAQLCCPSNSGS